MVRPINANTPVPVLNLHVKDNRVESPFGDKEYTSTELENYYVMPDEARSGNATHKMSFLEALSLFVV